MIEIVGRDEGPVRIPAVDRPDRLNAMAPSTVVELEERLRVAEADPGVGAVVLTGVGQHFSAGGDAHAIVDVMADEDEAAPLRLMRAFHRLIETVWNSELPVLGAVSGVAYGGGVNLALARAVEWGTQLAGGPRFAVSLTEKLINGSTTGDLYSSLELEAVSQTAAVRGRAAREGFERFVRRDDRASKPASGTSS